MDQIRIASIDDVLGDLLIAAARAAECQQALDRLQEGVHSEPLRHHVDTGEFARLLAAAGKLRSELLDQLTQVQEAQKNITSGYEKT